MAPRTRRTRKQDSRARARPSRVTTGSAFSSSSGKVDAVGSNDGGSKAAELSSTEGATKAATSQFQSMTLGPDEKAKTQSINTADPQLDTEQHPSATEKDCAPDCKCLLRGRGFFMPAGLEDESDEALIGRS